MRLSFLFLTKRFDGKKWKIRKNSNQVCDFQQAAIWRKKVKNIRENLIQVCDFLPAAIWQIFFEIFTHTFQTKKLSLILYILKNELESE